MYVSLHTYLNVSDHISMHVHIHVCIHMSHRGGLQQYFYSLHALGIIRQQQSCFGAIC